MALLARWALRNRGITSGLFTAARSHSAGSTVAMVANSPPSATCYGTSVRSQERQPSRRAPTAAPSLHEQRQGTDTWHTRNASNDGRHNEQKLGEFCITLFAVHLRALPGVFFTFLPGRLGVQN